MSEADELVVAELDRELDALVAAWYDRGVPLDVSAQVVCGYGASKLCGLGISFSDLAIVMAQKWRQHGGKP